ncbi:hypothetical protein Cni_G27564 [Canna indica]|uniref:Uncharacterized protein n=1 Tax=Canna indica TaxID=4628 RepID=A0AAQ3L816_9LILI|nr:hypothetical protein Cni_G27564 [Canna indica]
MGTCASKCYTDPFVPIDSNVVKEKLVVSESLPPISSVSDLSKKEANTSYSSSSSSSSSASVSSPHPSTLQLFPPPPPSSSCSSSLGANCSSRSQTPPTDGSMLNKSLLSKNNMKPAAVDPGNHEMMNPRIHKRQVGRPPKQPITRSSQSIPVKRARSCSPAPVVERKSFTSEHGLAAAPSSRSISSTPKLGRSRSLVGRSGNHVQLTARKESIQASSPINLSLIQRSSSMGKEAGLNHMHQIHQKQLEQIGSMEEFSRQSSITNVPLKEDLDNPLISMDCFIFL